MPGGRPTKYKAEHCDQVIDHFREGWSIAEICLELDICEKTFLNWVNTKDEFLQAKKKRSVFFRGLVDEARTQKPREQRVQFHPLVHEHEKPFWLER